MEREFNRMATERQVRIVLSEGVKRVTFKDPVGNVVGKIVRGITGNPIIDGVILNSGPRIVEMEYDK